MIFLDCVCLCIYVRERKTDLNSSTPFNYIYTQLLSSHMTIFSFLFVLGYNKGTSKFSNYEASLSLIGTRTNCHIECINTSPDLEGLTVSYMSKFQWYFFDSTAMPTNGRESTPKIKPSWFCIHSCQRYGHSHCIQDNLIVALSYLV